MNFTTSVRRATIRAGRLDQRMLIGAVLVLSLLLGGAYWLRRAEILPAPLPTPIPIGKETYTVRKIQVLQGHEFDITLDSDRRVHAFLRVKTPPNAKEQVILLLNKSRKPQVVVFEKTPDGLVVDLSFEYGGSTTSLTDWLRANKLVWE